MAQVVLRRILLTMIVLLLLNSGAIAKGTFEVVCQCGGHSPKHKLTKLQDGRILISDFYDISYSREESMPEDYVTQFEIYDPKTKTLKRIAQPKIWHSPETTPIVLDDGKVFLLGDWMGWDNPKPFHLQMYKDSLHAELYDPVTDTYEIVGAMHASRVLFDMVKLKDGKIFVMNGVETGIEELKTDATIWQSELYDPATKDFTLHAESSIDIREKYAKVGKEIYSYDEYINKVKDTLKPVYPEGDIRNRLPVPKVEIYEVRQATGGKAIVLDNGEVLVFGIYDHTTEIYDPKTQKFRRIMDRDFRYRETATFYNLTDGRVMLMDDSVSYGEIYDSKTEQITSFDAIPLEERLGSNFRTLLLPDDKILVYGGRQSAWGILKASFKVHAIQLYDIKTNTIKTIDSKPRNIDLGAAVQLDDGSIFFLASINNLCRGIVYKNNELIKGDKHGTRTIRARNSKR